ncbi:MAG: GNAT family N-acetyltransferase [Sulfitobacter sp.]
MVDADIRPIDPVADLALVQTLCLRGTEYITLETGAPPAEGYAATLLAEAPPSVPTRDVLAFGALDEGMLCALLKCLRNFYAPREWYLGLLLVDPAARRGGLGTQMVAHVRRLARTQNARCMRMAVLDANPQGRAFWAHQGFVHERTVPGDPAGDGHIRHILKLELGG